MSVTTKSRAKREPITAPATTPALNGSSKASAEGGRGGMKEIGRGKEQKRQELRAICEEVLLSFGRGTGRDRLVL